MNDRTPRLSLIVPSYNEESRIEASMERIAAFLSTLSYKCEVIVVDDGSRAEGRAAAERAVKLLPANIQSTLLVHEHNRGKGGAVRTGCLAASGQRIAFIDADLATPPEDLPGLLGALDAGADIAIGVRTQGDGSDMRDRRGLARRTAGRLFAFVMRTVLLPDMGDSQCPLKAFQGSAARRLFTLQRVETWAFDAELLFLASKLGLKVAKVPVGWKAVDGSHLRLNLKSAMELWNLLRIRWAHRGVSATTLLEATAPAR